MANSWFTPFHSIRFAWDQAQLRSSVTFATLVLLQWLKVHFRQVIV